jgi:hypothetical protein
LTPPPRHGDEADGGQGLRYGQHSQGTVGYRRTRRGADAKKRAAMDRARFGTDPANWRRGSIRRPDHRKCRRRLGGPHREPSRHKYDAARNAAEPILVVSRSNSPVPGASPNCSRPPLGRVAAEEALLPGSAQQHAPPAAPSTPTPRPTTAWKCASRTSSRTLRGWVFG